MLAPVHPGEVLKEEFMAPYGLSANALARAIHVPPNRITAILNGTRGVSADTALRLARAFGMTPDFWLNLQNTYDLDVAKSISKFDESSETIRLHFVKLVRESFDADSELTVDARGSDLKIRIQWEISESDRPNKKSRSLTVQFDRGLVEDYLDAKKDARALTDKNICLRLKDKNKVFVREHDHPKHVPPPNEDLTVGSESMLYP